MSKDPNGKGKYSGFHLDFICVLDDIRVLRFSDVNEMIPFFYHIPGAIVSNDVFLWVICFNFFNSNILFPKRYETKQV
jgi:hypothetical protein